MSKERAILHCDINNFYASVALLSLPELKDKPVAICGDPEKRHGIILAKNNIAKRYDVKTGEALWLARQKCADLILLPTDFKKYVYYSQKIFDIYIRYTSEVESFGLDECWLDVTGSTRLFGDPITIAYSIKETVKKETGLTISVGVSFTKTFAKLGSDLKKPDAVSIISKDSFKDIVWKLPAKEMLLIGRATADKLEKSNILTIGDLAKSSKTQLVKQFGKAGETMYLAANGQDDELVKCYTDHRIPESIGNGTTTIKDVENLEEAIATVYSLAEIVATRLRKYHMVALGVQVSLRNNELKSKTRQMQLFFPICTAKQIADAAIKIIENEYDFNTMCALRAITVTTYHLQGDDEVFQNYFFENGEKEEKVEGRIDEIRKKYGYSAIKRGISFGSVFDCVLRDEEDGYIPFGKDGKGINTDIND